MHHIMLETVGLPLVLLIGAYLLGSLSSAILLCKLAGLPDPRSQGSGNPGATNVLRFGGKKLAATVLLLDVLKGTLPVLLAALLGVTMDWLAAIALAAFLGHLYPVFFEFKGGKGVATALGGLLALSPLLALTILATWLVVFLVSRISSLSAIVAATLAPMYSFWFLDTTPARWILIVMALLLLYRHKSNIQRILSGEETKP